MNLGQLLNIQRMGGIKVGKGEGVYTGSVGGTPITEKQAYAIANGIGWLSIDMAPIEVIDRTNKFIGGLRKTLSDSPMIMGADIQFQNIRKADSMSYFDRVKITYPGKLDITILCGAPGAGGRYKIYSDINNFNFPVKGCRSLGDVGKWINERL